MPEIDGPPGRRIISGDAGRGAMSATSHPQELHMPKGTVKTKKNNKPKVSIKEKQAKKKAAKSK
jgi:hypothetical protein